MRESGNGMELENGGDDVALTHRRGTHGEIGSHRRQDIQSCHPGPPGDPAEQCDGHPSAKAVNDLQQQSKGWLDQQYQRTLDTGPEPQRASSSP
ncbi:hypothetical protein DPX16_14119 [Anabarilius grahami]|uniref:Uncharacterized protein n=1 Tax=Anabarilius grahami TaxID=495550 RepID=A0A3N0Y908_ANAGA|nr:hypothetical protein DPX16_14119 [Anabarilius grahami]